MNANLEIIEKYINGELEGKELLDFENLLSSNSEVRRDYNLSMSINSSIMEDDVMALRETLKQLHNDDTKVKQLPQRFARKHFYYAAASIALLIATGGLVQRFSGHEMDNAAIFNKFYTPYQVTVTYRSGNTDVDRILLNALESYEECDYEKALVLFEEVLTSKKDNMSLNLYSGITYMEEDKYQKAKKSFNAIIADNDNLFIEQAKWYLAMCYIKTENNGSAKEILKELYKNNSFYKDQASQVLKELK